MVGEENPSVGGGGRGEECAEDGERHLLGREFRCSKSITGVGGGEHFDPRRD